MYFVFAMYGYLPCGGVKDLYTKTDTLDEAREKAKEAMTKTYGPDCYHITDSNLNIVEQGNRKDFPI